MKEQILPEKNQNYYYSEINKTGRYHSVILEFITMWFNLIATSETQDVNELVFTAFWIIIILPKK